MIPDGGLRGDGSRANAASAPDQTDLVRPAATNAASQTVPNLKADKRAIGLAR
jgi:hypothetical protein